MRNAASKRNPRKFRETIRTRIHQEVDFARLHVCNSLIQPVHGLAIVVKPIMACRSTACTGVMARLHADPKMIDDTDQRHLLLSRQRQFLLDLNWHPVNTSTTANLEHEHVGSRNHALLTRMLRVATASRAVEIINHWCTGRKVHL